MNPLTQSKHTTILPVLIALMLGCFALSPTARAVDPPPDGGYPRQNTADGTDALFTLTTGFDNTALGFHTLYNNTAGHDNTATGDRALLSNATVTLSPSPTPPVTAKRPHGIMQLLKRNFNDTDGFTNPAMDGVRLRMAWNEIQKAVDGPYDWSKIDRAVANAKKNGKQIGISVAAVAPDSNPTGLEAAGCKMVQLSTGSVPWINDPVFLGKWGKFIVDFGARYDGKVDYVVMGGLGVKNFESHFAQTPEDMAAMDTHGGLEGWKIAVKQISQFYSSAFPSTHFEFTAGNPYRNNDGKTALKEVLDYIAPKYGSLFGIMDSALKATSNIGYPPHAYINKYADTNSCGFQFLTNCEGGFGGHTCDGTLKEVLDKGVELLKGKGYIEVYSADADKASNAQIFKDASAKLK